MDNIRNIIRTVVEEIYQPKESDNFTDKKGQRIVTGKLVKKDDNRGRIEGVTIDLKVKVLWFLPEEMKGKITAEDPKAIEIY
jgi:hypothetical protein